MQATQHAVITVIRPHLMCASSVKLNQALIGSRTPNCRNFWYCLYGLCLQHIQYAAVAAWNWAVVYGAVGGLLVGTLPF